jgi:ankyrin repeat protein
MDPVPSGRNPNTEHQGQQIVNDAIPAGRESDLLDELSQQLLDAVRDRNQAAVRLLVDGGLVDGGANLSAKNTEGQTPLHLAVKNDDVSMVQLLLERGADPDATAANGNKPLYDAAESGYLSIVGLLLEFNANVEAFNFDQQRTAFYQAVENGHTAVAKILLQDGADIDTRSTSGLTPLFCAVRRGDVDLVEYLLEHGANKKLQLDDGQTLEDFSKGNAAITTLLQSSQVIQGPSLTAPEPIDPERRFTPIPSLPADQINKQEVCHGFEATIIDFFLGDREERIQVSASIYDVLYGKGAEAIMDSAKGSMMGEQHRRFRWYHLPANNVGFFTNPLIFMNLTMK